MKKSKKGLIVALAIMLAAITVPAFAAEPTTISGVWEVTNTNGEKYYYYFSPEAETVGSEVHGKAVGVWVIPNIEIAGGGEQIHLVHGYWVFVERDGKQLFAVVDGKLRVGGMWRSVPSNLLGPYYYRFTTENGTQKMILIDASGAEVHPLIKTGTKLSDLPELGELAGLNSTGGRWWGQVGVVIK